MGRAGSLAGVVAGGDFKIEGSVRVRFGQDRTLAVRFGSVQFGMVVMWAGPVSFLSRGPDPFKACVLSGLD
jgi:hypothetical protein